VSAWEGSAAQHAAERANAVGPEDFGGTDEGSHLTAQTRIVAPAPEPFRLEPVGDTASAYDAIAKDYDGLWNGALAFAENHTLFTRLLGGQHLQGRVLDVGCGTGLLLDWCGEWVPPACYQGVDISDGMLKQARRKHPAYGFGLANADDMARSAVVRGRQFDSIVSLFAVPSYLSDLEGFLTWCFEALASGGKIALMPFGPGESWVPEEYRLKDAKGHPVAHQNWDAGSLRHVLERVGFEQIRTYGYTSYGFHDRHGGVRSAVRFQNMIKAYGRDFHWLQNNMDHAIFTLGTAVKP
jgi:predicted TPR repeat methyltransferase